MKSPGECNTTAAKALSTLNDEPLLDSQWNNNNNNINDINDNNNNNQQDTETNKSNSKKPNRGNRSHPMMKFESCHKWSAIYCCTLRAI